MNRRRLFLFALATDRLVEVSATSVSLAIDAATAALPHLEVAASERSDASNQQHRYTLTCLLCGLVKPQHPSHTSLVALQEHVWMEHGLPYEEQALAASVFDGTAEAGCYVWWTPAHGAYFRASRSASRPDEHPPHRLFTAEQIPVAARQEGKLILISCIDAVEPLEAQLVGEDERAWYGRFSGGKGERLLIFPRSWWTTFFGDADAKRRSSDE